MALDEAVHLFLATAADMGNLEAVLQESDKALKQQDGKQERKRSEKIVFAIHDSDVAGGEFRRANAYE